MFKKRQNEVDLPLVDWDAKRVKPYKLYRLEDLRGTEPLDGHDPKVPHRIGFHALMLVTEGSFDHVLEFQTHRLSRNQMIYIAPNHIHNFVKNTEAHKAFILAFRPEILPAELLQVDGKRVPWSVISCRWPSITKLLPNETALIEQQLQLLCELDSKLPNSSVAATQYHVCGTSSLAFELAKKNHNESADWRLNPRFLKFVQLVEENFTSRRDVMWYAKQQDCSQRTLNRICQRMLGKTAKAYLTERVVVEAKRLLAYEVDTVNEAADRVGFGATTNFVRYFKNETGMTPQEFKVPAIQEDAHSKRVSRDFGKGF